MFRKTASLKGSVCLFCFLWLSSSASAWPHFTKPHPIGFVKHHKLLIVEGGLFLAADAADTQTTVNALARCQTCVEGSEVFGQRPSALRLWGESEAFNAAYITLFWWGNYKANPPWTRGDKTECNCPKVYWMSNHLERPIIGMVVAEGAVLHARAAYLNAQIPTSPPPK